MADSETTATTAGRSPDSRNRRQKFIKLAEKRTVNAIKAIRIIGKLGNPNAYEYDENDVRKIVKALNDEIEAMKTRMKNTKPPDDVAFRL